MKERNINRKLALKRARETVVRRKSLHYDIGIFLGKFKMRTTVHLMEEFSHMIGEGFKGYHKMRGRELIKNFETVYTNLRDKEGVVSIHSNVANSFGVKSRMAWHLYDEKNPTRVVDAFILDSESLMTRLMELAFNLDVEE